MSQSESEKGPAPLSDDQLHNFDEEADVAAPEPLERARTQESVQGDMIARMLTQSSLASRRSKRDARTPLPVMGGGKDYPPELPEDREPFKVEYDGPDDPIHPFNWPLRKKIISSAVFGYTTMCVAWGSAIFAAAVPAVAKEFHVGEVTAILGVTLYVLGFASGPVLWAPLSELYGRRIVTLISVFGLMVFSFASATAKDFQTLMLTRFFGGFIGAAPLAVVAAAFADLFNAKQRGLALTLFSATVFCGPIIAPVAGGFIVASYLGWRWTEYITGIMAALALVLDIFLVEETYHPIILVRKAQELRRRTGNWGIHAAHEEVELDINDIITKQLVRPISMLIFEPILLLLTIYTGFIYGILYLLLEAYPLVFTEGYKMKGGVGELPYLSLAIGEILSGVVISQVFEPMYVRAMERNGGKIVPEYRLLGAIAGGIAFPIGIFWFTWTGAYHEHVHWIVPTISGLFSGFGLMSIFLSAINYIVDTYLIFAASAMAGNTFLRSVCGAVFPLFANAMFKNLGTQWAGTLIGCLAILLAPVPVLFFFFGKRIRGHSKYAFDLA